MIGNRIRARKKSWSRPALFFMPEAGGLQVGLGDAQRPDHQVPAVGRPADAVAGDLVGVEAPAAQVLARRRGVGRGAQPLVVPGRGRLGHLEQAGLALAPLALVALGVAQGDAGPAGQRLDGADEVQLLLLAQERDGVARGLAPEAVVEALLGVDREARRLLGVERAQPAPALTRPASAGCTAR